jgi:RNA-directed DNA polymerase
MGGWVVAQSPILGTTITLERLGKRGYDPSVDGDYYRKVSTQLNSLSRFWFGKPLYTRHVRTVGVRGSSRYRKVAGQSRLAFRALF